MLLIGFAVFIFIKSMLYYRFSLGVFISIMLLVPLSAILVFIFLGAEILAALGRDPTLTGRTQLWGWGIDVALQKPWLGWGYQAYMGSEHAQAYALTIPRFVNYDVPHFHNAYIQILVELGFLGFLFYFFTYMVVVGRLYILSAYRQYMGLLPLLAILTLLLISSFFINTFFQYNDFSTILFFISAITVSGNYTLTRSGVQS
ncbi:MAG: O-antigen ligase domain-containing protein [Halomonas sp.]|nr:MAG: O-antigen ligase domain-containing protein [Halomonas sp.]